MPTYDYVCDACQHKFEQFQSIKDSPLKKCPQCAKMKLRRLIGPGAAIIFKGSGFYQTDYRSKSYSEGAAAEKKAADGKKNSQSKSDAKPAKDKASASTSE